MFVLRARKLYKVGQNICIQPDKKGCQDIQPISVYLPGTTFAPSSGEINSSRFGMVPPTGVLKSQVGDRTPFISPQL